MTRAGARPAVLFDVDGTLIDSNYLHVHAWYRAFTEANVEVEAWRIHRSIGMDGSALQASLAEAADEDTRARLKDRHSRHYQETAPLLRRLPGARELLEAVDKLGLQIVLATSAPEDELSLLREVLASDDLVSAVTSSKDVDTAKPESDIVQVALKRASVDVAHAVFVGDTVWDVEACERAGVPTIAVLSGGVSRGELETAGAQAVSTIPATCASTWTARRSGRWPRPSRRPDQPSSCRHSVSTSHSSNRLAVQPRTLTSRSKIAGSIASQTTSTASW